jgi:methylenetetrahydrofolate reductase (NADPH)
VSRLQELLERGEFVVCGELGPPQGCDVETVTRKATYFRGQVDAVNVTDNQTAIVRMSSIAACALLKQQGLEPVVQVTCRDRNRIGLQSDFLGAVGLGLENFLCLTGDHQSFGNHPQSANVFDLDSVQLLQMLRALRDQGLFQCGDEMKGPRPQAFLGAGANPFADPFEFRVMRLQKKIAAGAQFVQTQCVFDLERFKRFMDLVRRRGLHEKAYLIAGIMPVRSAKALARSRDVPGMMIPQEQIDRLEKAAEPQDEGVNLAVELIQQVREVEGVRGVHLMPVMWESITPTVVERAGLLPRPTWGSADAGQGSAPGQDKGNP